MRASLLGWLIQAAVGIFGGSGRRCRNPLRVRFVGGVQGRPALLPDLGGGAVVARRPQLLPLIDQVRVRRGGPGRPRQRPDRVLADKAYSHPSTRAALRARGIAFTSPEKRDQIARRKAQGLPRRTTTRLRPDRVRRPVSVGRCFNRLKRFRDLATRYAKRAAYYRAEILIAATILWLREHSQDTP